MKARKRDARRSADETVLAFRRTAMQIGLVGLAAVRMLTEHIGWWVAGAALMAVVLIIAVERSAQTYAGTVDEDGRVEWAPHGEGNAWARHAIVAGATGAVAALALAWIVLQR